MAKTISKHDYSENAYDCIEISENYIDVICSNKKYANEIADVIMTENSNIMCIDFRKTNGGYKFSVIPMMNESKKRNMRKSLKESSITKEAEKALKNALLNGKEFDIPFKYSDDVEFTDELESLLYDNGYKFEGSMIDKKYGVVHIYSCEGLDETDVWTIGLIMDSSLKRDMCRNYFKYILI